MMAYPNLSVFIGLVQLFACSPDALLGFTSPARGPHNLDLQRGLIFWVCRVFFLPRFFSTVLKIKL